MSEMHSKAIKGKKLDVDTDERDKVFLQEQIIKERNKSVKIKSALQKASERYDNLYKVAQDFIRQSNDKEKVKELLQILQETDEERQ